MLFSFDLLEFKGTIKISSRKRLSAARQTKIRNFCEQTKEQNIQPQKCLGDPVRAFKKSESFSFSFSSGKEKKRP